jgi:hypothetical protein
LACLREPPDQACELFAWARCRTRAGGHEKSPEQSGKLPMPLLNPRVARRANERHIADPVGPIIAKCRVFMTPTLATAERCHGSYSGQNALACSRERTVDVPSLQLPALLCVPGRGSGGRIVGGAGKPRRSVEHIPPKRLIPARRYGEYLGFVVRGHHLLQSRPCTPSAADTVDWSLPETESSDELPCLRQPNAARLGRAA